MMFNLYSLTSRLLSGGAMFAALSVPCFAQDAKPSRVVSSYAKIFKVSQEEAAKRIEFQKEVGEIDGRLTESEKPTFGGLYIEHLPTYRIVAKFTRDGAATLTKYTQDPRFVVDVATQTLADLSAAQSTLGILLKPLNVSGVSNIDVKTGRIKLYVPNPEAVLAARSAGTLKLPDFVDVLKAVDTSSEREAKIEGGRGVNAGGFDCTIGVTVYLKSNINTRYLITAGHCKAPMSYNGVNLPLVGEKYDINTAYDYEWHSTPGFDKLSNNIYDGVDDTYRMTVTTTFANMSIGQYLCKWGLVTGYTCGNINSKSYMPTGSPNSFVQVHEYYGNNMSSPGDSGGPYYIDGQTGNAFGIHSDSAKFVDPNDSVFMPLSYISASNLAVLTTQ